MAGVGDGAAAADDKLASRREPVDKSSQESLDIPHSVEKPRNLNLLACGSNHRSLIGKKHPFALILASHHYFHA